MEDKLKTFIQKKIDDANRYSENIHDVRNYRGQAFGALMFAQEYNKDLDWDDVGKWWDDYTWVQFRLIEEQFIYN